MSLVKNCIPKFNTTSKIPSRIKDIMFNVFENPIKIPNYLVEDSRGLYKKSNTEYKNTQISPYNNNNHIVEYNNMCYNDIENYYKNYKKVKEYWEDVPFSEKKRIFLDTADLIENKYYDKMLAYTILGQNKTVYEAEVDAICELVDFLRFNVSYAEEILKKQPIQIPGNKNISEYNSLNGFVAAITPFNFTAIGANLASIPLLFGNSVLWKPSDSSILSNHLFYEIMKEAGLPKGVLNFCPMSPKLFLDSIIKREDLGGLLFTGSSSVFEYMYSEIGNNIKHYNNFPRIIGETGGKNFHFMDPSYKNENTLERLFNINNIDYVVEKTVESAFGYSGQKCSACSVMYVPKDLLDIVLRKLKIKSKKFVDNMSNYGLINKKAYYRTIMKLDSIKKDKEIDIILEGSMCDSYEYYVEPHIVVCNNPKNRVFNEEFFAPILAIYPYDESEMNEVMDMCINGNKYGLTGSIFSLDNDFINKFKKKTRHKTGNFYINDKSTGSVVGQQPFGGSGKSGTNDKAGDINLLYRLVNQRNIKINYNY